jgi:tetratricopeptide (TPR) repeat protein
VSDPGIKPGQGWSDAFPAGASAAVTPAPKPQPAKAAVAAAQPTRELSEFTRDAETWEEFFAGSSRRPRAFFIQHLADVETFLQQHPATSEQLRAAYRRARAALRPTPGTARGLEFGAQFVAYHLALLENGLAETDAAAWVRDDFLQLARTDIYNAHHVLMGVQNIAPLQKLLPDQQNAQIREIAGRVVKREPLPKVGEATPAAPAVATTSAPARPAPAGGAPGFAPRFSTSSVAGHWDLSTNFFGRDGRRFTGQIRFEGGDGVVRAVVFDPLSNNPKRGSAGINEQRVGALQQVQRTLMFRFNEFAYTGVFDPRNLGGNIMRGNDVVGSWTAVRRMDLDYLVVARAAGKTPEAIAAYDAAIRENPLASYRMERAGLHYDNRDHALAIADYDEVIKVTPNHINARFNRMLSHYYARQREQALTDADHLLENKLVRGEQHAITLFMRGEILWWLERHDEADQAYAAAIELDPKLAERTRAAGTREGALARMAANAARVNAIMSRLNEGMAESTAQLKAAAAASTGTAAAPGPEIPASPSQQVLSLYESLRAKFTHPNADLTAPEFTAGLDLVAKLIPAARHIFTEGYREVVRAFDATQPANDVSFAGNPCRTAPLFTRVN